MSQSSWDTESKLSSLVSRLSGGRISIGVRTNRYSNDCMNHNLFFLIGPLNASRGVNASIPVHLPPRLAKRGKKLCASKLNLFVPERVSTAVTPLVNLPYSAAYGFVNTCADSTASIGRLIANAPVTGSVTLALLT